VFAFGSGRRANREKAEMRFVSEFRETFGPLEEVVVAHGDWKLSDHMAG
jgi:hypothetical protein